MMILVHLLFLAGWLCVSWFAAGEFYKIAEDKGYHGKKYFWWCFLAPPVGHLMIVAMPDRGRDQQVVVNEDLPALYGKAAPRAVSEHTRPPDRGKGRRPVRPCGTVRKKRESPAKMQQAAFSPGILTQTGTAAHP